MDWQFWKPKHTVASVARKLADGLRDGSIALDEPIKDEPFDDDMNAGLENPPPQKDVESS